MGALGLSHGLHTLLAICAVSQHRFGTSILFLDYDYFNKTSSGCQDSRWCDIFDFLSPRPLRRPHKFESSSMRAFLCNDMDKRVINCPAIINIPVALNTFHKHSWQTASPRLSIPFALIPREMIPYNISPRQHVCCRIRRQ